MGLYLIAEIGINHNGSLDIAIDTLPISTIMAIRWRMS